MTRGRVALRFFGCVARTLEDGGVCKVVDEDAWVLASMVDACCIAVGSVSVTEGGATTTVDGTMGSVSDACSCNVGSFVCATGNTVIGDVMAFVMGVVMTTLRSGRFRLVNVGA